MGYECSVTRRLRRALILTHAHHANNVCCNYHRYVSQMRCFRARSANALSRARPAPPGDRHTRTPDARASSATRGASSAPHCQHRPLAAPHTHHRRLRRRDVPTIPHRPRRSPYSPTHDQHPPPRHRGRRHSRAAPTRRLAAGPIISTATPHTDQSRTTPHATARDAHH